MVVTSDDPSTISDSRRMDISLRDGGACVLCGDEPVDVAHIVAQKAGDPGQVLFIRSISPLYQDFQKDNSSNLLCLCPTHHHQYDQGYYVLVPSQRQREVLLEYEYSDFAKRKSAIAYGQPDPGRTFPTILDEIEYIPIYQRGHHAYIHSPTRYDPEVFMFDSLDRRPCPLLHFRASGISLMVQAQRRLANVTRIQNIKAELAEKQVTTLLKLYRRHPGAATAHFPIQFPTLYEQIKSTIIQSNIHSGSHISSTIPSSPLASSSHPSATTDRASSEDTVASSDFDYDAQLDHDPLLGPVEEQPITWEDSKNRLAIFQR